MILALAIAAWITSAACTARDCAEERAGQMRCVANRLETCNADGTLSYQSCTAVGLLCSEQHKGCVTKAVLEGSTSSSGGAGGAGGDAGAGGDPEGGGGTGG